MDTSAAPVVTMAAPGNGEGSVRYSPSVLLKLRGLSSSCSSLSELLDAESAPSMVVGVMELPVVVAFRRGDGGFVGLFTPPLIMGGVVVVFAVAAVGGSSTMKKSSNWSLSMGSSTSSSSSSLSPLWFELFATRLIVK